MSRVKLACLLFTLLTVSVLTTPIFATGLNVFSVEDLARAILLHRNLDGGFGEERDLETTFYGAMALYYVDALDEGKLKDIGEFVLKHYIVAEGRFSPISNLIVPSYDYYAVKLLSLAGLTNALQNKSLLVLQLRDGFFETLREYEMKSEQVSGSFLLETAANLVEALRLLGYTFAEDELDKVLNVVKEAISQESDMSSLYSAVVIAREAGIDGKLDWNVLRGKLQNLFKNGLFVEWVDSDYATCQSNLGGVYLAKMLKLSYPKNSIISFAKDSIRWLRKRNYLSGLWDMKRLCYCAKLLYELDSVDAEVKGAVKELLMNLYNGGAFNSPSTLKGTFLALLSLKSLNKLGGINAEEIASLIVQDKFGHIYMKNYKTLYDLSTALGLGVLGLVNRLNRVDVFKALDSLEYEVHSLHDLFFLVWGLREAGLLDRADKFAILSKLNAYKTDGVYSYHLTEGAPSVMATLYAAVIKIMLGDFDREELSNLISEVEGMIMRDEGLFWIDFETSEWAAMLYLMVCKDLGIKPKPYIVYRFIGGTELVLEGVNIYTLTALSILREFIAPVIVKSEIPIPVSSDWLLYGTKLHLTIGLFSKEGGAVYVYPSENIRARFVGWYFGNGSLLSPEPEVELEVWGPMEIEARWKLQYYVNVTLPDDVRSLGIEVKGGGWYDAGATATVSVSKTVVDLGLEKLVFVGWVDEAGVQLSDQQNYSFTVDSPKVLKAVWRREASYVPVLVAVIIVVALIAAALYFRRRRSS